jgi:hypothetical protein
MKSEALVVPQEEAVTTISPLVAPNGTMAVIWVELFTVKFAAVPLKLTEVTQVKVVPVITTLAPATPEAGEKELMVGKTQTVKLEALVAVQEEDATVIVPVVAPEGTTAVICVELFTVTDAAVPLKFTVVPAIKFVPVITILEPTLPEAGEKEEMVGKTQTVKVEALVAAQEETATLIVPLVAPEGTTAVIWLELFTVKLAATPLNFTEVAPVKFVPVITTLDPILPEAGEKEPMVGKMQTVKLEALVAVQEEDATLIVPVVAPKGTTAVIWVELFTVKLAGVALNFTEVAPVKFVPVIITLDPTLPEAGEKVLMVGKIQTEKVPVLVTEQGETATVIVPLVAPEGTTAVIWVELFTVKLAAVPLKFTEVAPAKFVP